MSHSGQTAPSVKWMKEAFKVPAVEKEPPKGAKTLIRREMLKNVCGLGIVIFVIATCVFIVRYRNERTNVTTEYGIHIYPSDSSDSTTCPSGWTRYLLGDLATLAIPPTCELRGEGWLDDAMKERKRRMGVNGAAIVFQQTGLSSKSNWRYSRIMISIFKDNTRLWSKDALERWIREGLGASIDKNNGMGEAGASRILKWYPTITGTTYGNHYVRISYDRQLNTNPIVHVDYYLIWGKHRTVELTLSYRTTESDIWKADFEKIPTTLCFQ